MWPGVKQSSINSMPQSVLLILYNILVFNFVTVFILFVNMLCFLTI